MRDYKITLELAISAPDTLSAEDVMSRIMKAANLTTNQELGELQLTDVQTNIEVTTHLEGLDRMMALLECETVRSQKFNEELEAYTRSLGMTDEDYKPKPKPKERPSAAKKAAIKDINEVWNRCSVKDNIIVLPSEQLDRKVYDDVKKQLEAVGGKWKRAASGFVFDESTDANDVLKRLSGGADLAATKKEFQFFGTPDEVADRVAAEFDNVSEKQRWLEPSAGRGSLIKAVQRINSNVQFDAFEAMEDNKKVLAGM